MKRKAIARLWPGLRELITRDRFLTDKETHSASWNCLSECLDYKIMLDDLSSAHSPPFCFKVSLFPSSNLQNHKLLNLFKWHLQIHFPVKRTPLLNNKDTKLTAVYENVPCLLKETHKTHKCDTWRKYLYVYLHVFTVHQWSLNTLLSNQRHNIHGYYKRNRHFQRYVVSKPLA